ncbi:phosphatidic acid phosphatase [Leishmania donovani]|uniref:Phosphatidic_acid_phosphatase_putative/GeneDB:Lmj F.18.0440 n=1 Tax=Leishmania donovani TaxID=5661 RepID=A0A6J8FCU9_LEIDO|nr:phosphatidic acid phosphatase [Leishmania donovani]VDZ43874.1 phosphatidic_acid_phosphatase_putative/GeneDB:LmjF.18.0440 [Leishmania donovani]
MASCTVVALWRFIIFFRLHDYVLCLICGLVALGMSKVHPHCRPFSWTDPSINFPYAGAGTFPSWTLPIISILPVVVYILGEAARHLWLGRRRGAIMAREPCNQQKWLTMQGQRDGGGGAAQNAGEGQSCCDSASPLTFPSQSVQSALPAGRQGEIEVLVNSAPLSANVETREAQVGSSTVTTALSNCQPGSLRTPLANTHDEHTGNRESTSVADASPSRATASAPRKQKAHTYALAHPWQRFLFHAHIWFLTQAFSVAFALLVVNAIKVYAGRLRPDFLSRLRNEGYSPQSTGVDLCTVPKDGRVSFPSGHSSISFSAIVPFCFYVLHSLQAFRRSGVSLWRIFMGLLPLTLPIVVAVSRTRDNRHYFDDILAGSAIGIVSAVIAVSAIMVADARTGHLVPRIWYRPCSSARMHTRG